ncbi:hypothetical protein HYW74_03240 [Candidatus Pacearchaeota archaeon]|nr:hypothetical protein [Candidatus Pacearchaeota archaeon]
MDNVTKIYREIDKRFNLASSKDFMGLVYSLKNTYAPRLSENEQERLVEKITRGLNEEQRNKLGEALLLNSALGFYDGPDWSY